MSRFSKIKRKGFSLVELLVSFSIVTVILTVIVTSQSTYSDAAALQNLADEIGLNICLAQAYGIALRELSPGSEDFSISYGVSVSVIGEEDDKAYIFFADRNADGSYGGNWTCETGGANECLNKTTISRGNYVEEVCVVSLSGPDQCDNIGRVDVSFVRPKTEARIVFYNK